jgi:predicted membrane channel-forming protein YqfA (hemolysin III family)
MPITYKQMYDLDNAMTANQQVSLGQIISYLSGCTVVTGSLIPTAAVTVQPVSGLSSITLATVALSGSAGLTNTVDTVSAGSAGNIIIKAWTVSGSSLVAATTPFTKVVWTAYGA